MIRKLMPWLIMILIVGSTFIYWFLQSPYIQKMIYPLEYREEILAFSKEYGLDPHMVMGIIWVESKFRPEATSGKEAMGLMQIIPDTGKWIAGKLEVEGYGQEDLYDPETNIRFGCWYFSYLLKVFEGDVELALASYNGGMGNVAKWLKDSRYSLDGKRLHNIPFKETDDYLKRVMDAYRRYKELYDI